MTEHRISRVEARSLVDVVTERLEEAIITGEFAPGERIREQVVAATLGVSRGPLREAIRRLEGRRLLTRTTNLGVRVAELSPERLDDLLTVREALEGMACRLAATHLSDEQIAGLGRLIETHEADGDSKSDKGYYQESGDMDFHFQIANSVNNDLLTQMITGDLYDLLRIYRFKTSKMSGRAAMALAEHREIVAALQSRDPDRAETAMRTHIRNSRLYAAMAMKEDGE